jgi:hypothetical protein
MKGLIRKAAVVFGCAVGASGVGCDTLPTQCGNGADRCCKDLYDRCYPERYWQIARKEVNRGFTPQVVNGHVLDQTVWNHFFEPGTDKLTPGGQTHLQYLSRRRPQPDCTVYLATALDIGYDPACPERYAGARQELDALRVAAVQKYLTALNAGRHSEFQVLIHDPGDVTIAAFPAGVAIQQMYGRYRGGLGGAGGGGGGTTGPTGTVGGFAGGGGAASR